MGLLLRSGKQILGLSSAVAKSRQQLGISAANKYHHFLSSSTTTKSSDHGRFLVANNKRMYLSTNTTQNNADDKDLEIPPMTFKRFFSGLFTRRRYSLHTFPPPPPLTPFRELLGEFMELAEMSKDCPEDRLPLVLDAICPILNELLQRITDGSIVKFVYEFARQETSPSSPVLDSKIKNIVDKLPPRVIGLFQDMISCVLRARFEGGSPWDVSLPPESESVVIISDVSHIRKERLNLFVVEDILIVAGTDDIAAPPHIALSKSTIHQVIDMPGGTYSDDELTATIVEEEDQGQGRRSKLNIVFPIHDEPEKLVVNRRSVFQLNLNTQGTPQG